ncbi:MAG TPA: VOC family protein [Thermoanaerobaculia bacterium]|nr:VOC family protein [Thermoanaerobaculia bacterium]
MSELLAATPQFTVPDLIRTVSYYRDVLGFEVAGYWDGEQVSDEPRDPVFAIVQRDRVRIFFNRGAAAQTGRADGAYDVYFTVNGVDELASDFRTRGAEILDGPEDRVYGQREVVIRDCNGIVLTFGEPR